VSLDFGSIIDCEMSDIQVVQVQEQQVPGTVGDYFDCARLQKEKI